MSGKWVSYTALLVSAASMAVCAYFLKVHGSPDKGDVAPQKTGRMEIVDTYGKVRIRLSADEIGGPRISMMSEDGKERVRLRIDDRGRALISAGPTEGRSSAAIYSESSGKTMFRLDDPLGNPRAVMSVDETGGPVVALYDESSRVRVTIGKSSLYDREARSMVYKPESTITLTDSSGSLVWMSPDNVFQGQPAPPPQQGVRQQGWTPPPQQGTLR